MDLDPPDPAWHQNVFSLPWTPLCQCTLSTEHGLCGSLGVICVHFFSPHILRTVLRRFQKHLGMGCEAPWMDDALLVLTQQAQMIFTLLSGSFRVPQVL